MTGERAAKFVAKARVHLLAATMTVYGRGTADNVADMVNDLMEMENADVQGNRPDSSDVCWGDLELMLTATIRDCLHILEGEEG